MLVSGSRHALVNGTMGQDFVPSGTDQMLSFAVENGGAQAQVFGPLF